MSIKRTFDQKKLERVVKKFDAIEWDRLLFSFNFSEIEERLNDGEIMGFYDFYKDPSIGFTPLVINFMKAALSSDKFLAQDTIKHTEQAIETIKSRKCGEDI